MKTKIIVIFLLLFSTVNFQPELIFGKLRLNTLIDIKDSHHDFIGAAWSGNRACRPCHTPHYANMEVPNSPLWNHQNTVATFQIYTSETMDGTIGQPTGKTKLCLSCHDGTVAIENHGGFTGGTRYATFGNLGTNLNNDHPLSFTYDTQLSQVDGGLHDPSTTSSGLGGTIAEDLLDNGKLSCISCHDVHISRNTEGCTGCHFVHGGMITRTLSLKIPNENSELCLTCHDK